MERFTFSLQKILDLRNFELDQAETELGKVNAKIAAINRQLENFARERVKAAGITDSSPDFMTAYQAQAYITLLNNKKEECLKQLAVLEMEADQKREVVRLAMQKVKALEKIKEKKKAAWLLEATRKEQKEVDDIITAQSFRKMKNK